MAAIKDNKTLIELAHQFDVHQNEIKQWRDQLPEATTDVCGEPANFELEHRNNVNTLHAKIGELTVKNDVLSGSVGKAGLMRSARKQLTHIATQHHPTGSVAGDQSR